jgi:hypothetical protein
MAPEPQSANFNSPEEPENFTERLRELIASVWVEAGEPELAVLVAEAEAAVAEEKGKPVEDRRPPEVFWPAVWRRLAGRIVPGGMAPLLASVLPGLDFEAQLGVNRALVDGEAPGGAWLDRVAEAMDRERLLREARPTGGCGKGRESE